MSQFWLRVTVNVYHWEAFIWRHVSMANVCRRFTWNVSRNMFHCETFHDETFHDETFCHLSLLHAARIT